jgi:hypothetical protein
MYRIFIAFVCIGFLALINPLLASMPVSVKIAGCVENGYLMSYETDFGTHKVTRKDKPYRIKAVDTELKPLNLSHLEERKIEVAGSLLPSDLFIIEQKNIIILGWCGNKNKAGNNDDIPQKRKLSSKEQEELARQLYETMVKTDKWDTESFIKLHGRVIEECPDTQKAQESLWRLSNLYLLADEKKKKIGEEKAQKLIWSLPEVKEHSKRIKNMGKKPFTRIDARPEDPSGNGNFYIVYFGEDHGARVVNVMTFYVNAYTQRIYVYEPIFDTKYHIEQWRMMQ